MEKRGEVKGGKEGKERRERKERKGMEKGDMLEMKKKLHRGKRMCSACCQKGKHFVGLWEILSVPK